MVRGFFPPILPSFLVPELLFLRPLQSSPGGQGITWLVQLQFGISALWYNAWTIQTFSFMGYFCCFFTAYPPPQLTKVLSNSFASGSVFPPLAAYLRFPASILFFHCSSLSWGVSLINPDALLQGDPFLRHSQTRSHSWGPELVPKCICYLQLCNKLSWNLVV